MASSEDRLLTPKEACALLRVSMTKFKGLRLEYGLPTIRLGHRTLRVSERALMEWWQAQQARQARQPRLRKVADGK